MSSTGRLLGLLDVASASLYDKEYGWLMVNMRDDRKAHYCSLEFYRNEKRYQERFLLVLF